MKFDIHKKEWEAWLYENGTGKKFVGHSKLKLWIFFWDLVNEGCFIYDICFSFQSLKETPNWSEGVTLTPEEGFELFNRDNLKYPHTSTPNKIISHESPDPLEEELSPAQIIPSIESHTPKQEPRPLTNPLDSKPILTKKSSSTEATRSLKDRMRTGSPNSKDKVGIVKIDLSHVSDKVSRSPSASKYIVSHEEEIDGGVQIEEKNSSHNDLLSPMRDKRTLTDIHQVMISVLNS